MINIKSKIFNWINKIKMIIKIKKIQGKHASSQKSWIDPRLEARTSPIHKKGIFSKSPIKKGEKLMIWGGKVITRKIFKLEKQRSIKPLPLVKDDT